MHEEAFPVDPAYELSRLAFDIAFPNNSQSKSLGVWLKKNPNEKWDFIGTEPKKWTEDRVELQETLFDKWIKNKLTKPKKSIWMFLSIKDRFSSFEHIS